MKIWIPGGHGLVGTALQKKCRLKGITSIATGRELDISNLYEVKDFLNLNHSITHIINCAAYTHVDNAETEPDEAFKTNCLGPENLGKVAQRGIKLIHLSTDYVFNSNTPDFLQEEHLCNPMGVYASTKREGEIRLLKQLPHACIVRTSWVFGKGGKSFLSTLWDKLHNEVSLRIVNDQINRPTYAPDLADMLLSVMCHDGIYHFANAGVASRYDIAKEMAHLIQKKEGFVKCQEIVGIPSSLVPLKAPRPQFSILCTQKAERILGITPRDWTSALKEYINEQAS